MNLSISAWLQHKIDEYKYSVRDITVDYYMAQAKVDRPECTLEQLRKFNDTCLDMAELCQLNGDDHSYLHAMGKLHHRLVQELGNAERDRFVPYASLAVSPTFAYPLVPSTGNERRMG